MQQLMGIDGSQAYLLVTDHKSGNLWGVTSDNKVPPLAWLNKLLTRIKPEGVKGHYIMMDMGGELGRNKAVLNLLKKHDYDIRPTSPDSSHQNALLERPHATIGDAMRTMLLGAKLDLKYWPYAFYHYICLYNIIPHGSSILTPFEQVTGKRPNLSSLKTFGCRCYVRLPGRRPAKLDTHSRKGIFLG